MPLKNDSTPCCLPETIKTISKLKMLRHTYGGPCLLTLTDYQPPGDTVVMNDTKDGKQLLQKKEIILLPLHKNSSKESHLSAGRFPSKNKLVGDSTHKCARTCQLYYFVFLLTRLNVFPPSATLTYW